ncbi:hypothetical protein CAK95_24290 [Pseudorhodoplanes sinuspersici]|uniref:Uncharacterized protein n=2 Tax=Pseudorhodoplanes sinuspersici TaxID=1235591 RepID=A0A1W6ZWW1_9HYPH|nr:hypothetical protein CAK95_24290 [Pseudorhodoplanes sinuspersici]
MKLKRDNLSVGDYWILHSGDHVTITHQAVGEAPVAQIRVPRTTLNKLVDWYTREQTTRTE